MTTTPPGWYPDATVLGTNRYWDGQKWTEHTAPSEAVVAEPQPSEELSRGERRAAEAAAKAAQRAADAEAKAKQRAEDAFAASPAGRARAAFGSGDTIFQIVEPMGQKSYIAIFSGISQNSTINASSSAAILMSVEAEGWELKDLSYVYEETGQMSRDKLLSTGQQTTTLGRIVGIYTFRRRGPGR